MRFKYVYLMNVVQLENMLTPKYSTKDMALRVLLVKNANSRFLSIFLLSRVITQHGFHFAIIAKDSFQDLGHAPKLKIKI